MRIKSPPAACSVPGSVLMTPAAAVVACSSRGLGDGDAADMMFSYLLSGHSDARQGSAVGNVNSSALWYRAIVHYGISNTFGLVHFANQLSETREKRGIYDP